MNILLVGTAGYNLGDDALASILAHRLEQVFPAATVTVTSVNPGRLRSLGLKELTVNRKSLQSWLALLAQIRRSEFIFLGGGTLIQDALGVSLLRGMIPYIWQITFLAKLLGKRVATVPIGMDALQHDRARKMGRDILSRCEVVVLRDQRSFDLARDALQGDASSLLLSADPVFALRNVDGRATSEPVQQPYIVISYVREKRSEDVVIHELLSLLEAMRQRWPDHRLVLLSMDTREEDELGIYRKVIARLEEETVDVESPSDYRSAAAIIRGAAAVVAMRLHAMIIALGYVPVVGISRTTKTDTLIAQAEIYGLSVRDVSANKVTDLLTQALADDAKLAAQRTFVDAADQRFRTSMDELARRMHGGA